MNANKLKIIASLIDREGGYSNHPDDSGGATRYGITEKTARKYGYKQSMLSLPRTLAIDIYTKEYWPKELDQILSMSPQIAAEYFDTSVNMGPSFAAKFFQRSLNVLNNQEKNFADIVIDGKLGPKTVQAFTAYYKYRKQRGIRALLTAMNSLQGARYIALAEKRKKDETHLFGWLLHRIILS